MKVFVLGGDGFCGWPTSLHLSKRGWEVVIVDNLSRRNIDNELETESLTPIRPIGERLAAWQEITGKTIGFVRMDIAREFDRLADLLADERPDAVVHFAEQRAAPYSMKSARHKNYTVNNNLNATHNLVSAIVETGLDIHVVHLGTMGVYGYTSNGVVIPEGYFDVKVQAGNELVDMRIPFPPNPGSVYHMTKTQDALIFQFYNKNDGLRITDLHQGVVWGTNTKDTRLDERVINRFDYDSDYGTVLNRFLVQAAIGFPLTVYGTGGQTRAFINIQDTVRCIELALENPPETGELVKIFNQATETHRVRDLAKMVSDLTGVPIQPIDNPRLEAAENGLVIENQKFMALGLNPIRLSEGLLREISETASKYADRCDRTKILPSSTWRREHARA